MSGLDLNKPETWASAEIYSPPIHIDLAGYQSKIDKVAGLSETNWPMVRLVWAGDRQKCFSKFYVTWTPTGMGLASELRAKYRYMSLSVPGTASDVIDIPPARWLFEEYNHPGQYAASWEAARFVDGHEMRPGPPEGGYYSHLMTIAGHGNGDCCKKAVEDKVVCWGTYRDPDNEDIEILRRAFAKRELDRKVDLTKPLDEKTLDILGVETRNRVAKREEQEMANLREFIDEHALELLEAVGVPVSGRARKAFSIPTNYSKQESGIISRN